MSGATSPLWVTIMLGLLAVLGTVGGAWGGQWIAAKRDDRRWEREIAREDVRWQRELQRETLRLDHDERSRWRDVRLELYSELFAVFSEWSDKSGFYVLFTKLPDGQDHLPYEEFEGSGRFALAYERARLIASPMVVDALKELWTPLHRLATNMQDHKVITKRIENTRALMRAELGIAQSLSPSQPSDPTS